MNRLFAIAFLSLTLVGAAVAQKTNGTLVEVDSQRIADENWLTAEFQTVMAVTLWSNLLRLLPRKLMSSPAKKQRKTAVLELLTDGYPTTHATS